MSDRTRQKPISRTTRVMSTSAIRCRTGGFTLIELLVTISIIAVLISLLLAGLHQARLVTKRTVCASNTHQIAIAMATYHSDFEQTFFWRGNDVALDGMDWYVYGGRETGNLNLDQAGLFNNVVPRPLNNYVNQNVDAFRCPHDTDGLTWADGHTHFEWVGNSYSFNAIGYPLNPPPYAEEKGLAGRRVDQMRFPSRTVMFMDTSLHKAPGSWHGQSGNVVFVDGHAEFTGLPPDSPDSAYVWDP